MKIIVGVAGYNAEAYVDKCLLSIQQQSYSNFICYISDDQSSDTTRGLIKKIINGDDRFILVDNSEKRNQCGNYDLFCRKMPNVNPEDVFIEVDLDDWLPDRDVFQRVMNYYKNDNLWIANGSFQFANGNIGFSSPVSNFSNLRNSPYLASHLRTWRIFLWRALNPSDLRDKNGEWWSAGGDLIFMFDMLEMAGEEHYCFMPEINYIYNDLNPISDSKVNYNRVLEMIEFVKTKPIRPRLVC